MNLIKKFSIVICLLIITSVSFISCGNLGKSSADALDNDILKVHYIDVGCGDAILIQQGSHNMLIDAGSEDKKYIIRDYLKANNVKDLDYVVVSSPTQEHIGAMAYVINKYNIKNKIYTPNISTSTPEFENMITEIKKKNLKISSPVSDETFDLGKARCRILAPVKNSYSNISNYSVVIKVKFGEKSFLFTGDAEKESESEMMKSGNDIRADVLKVGNHGSSDSTTNDFLELVQPSYAVISSDKDNSEVIKRLLYKRGIKTFRTYTEGTIVASCDGDTIHFDKEYIYDWDKYNNEH